LADKAAAVDVDEVMAEVHRRVRGRMRSQLTEAGDAHFDDPEIFAEVESLLRAAAATPEVRPLILPELLGEPHTWRLTTKMAYQSHRSKGPASLIITLKQRVLMPLFRWLFEYSRDNFERQRRTNHVLFACVQELAIESALLRRELRRLSGARSAASPLDAPSNSSPRQ
jgi:hypothetical protein